MSGIWDLFTNMLGPWEWIWFGLIPPAILALYFLKLRRNPRIVPSTYLWRRALEDFRVNSLWQRLRQNLLLYLQLALVASLMLACLRPGWKGSSRSLDRTIFLIDNSASMSATDVAPNRLESGKKAVLERIEGMRPGDVAMLVSFSDHARVEQPFTNNLAILRRRLSEIAPTERRTDIREALRVAAGLANPGRTSSDAGDIQSADPLPADVVIVSDGGFPSLEDFSWGNLRPTYISRGDPQATNLAILALGAEPDPTQPDRLNAFVEIHNFSNAPSTTDVLLKEGETLIDATTQVIPPAATVSVEFSFASPASGEFTAELSVADVFSLDNRAFFAIRPPRKARVLVVTPGDPALDKVFGTEDAGKLAELTVLSPAEMSGPKYLELLASDALNLVIYDRCAPPKSPPTNAMYLAAVPPGDHWHLGEMGTGPQIIDQDVMHPLWRFIGLGNVTIATAQPVTAPSAGRILLDSNLGPLASIAPREVWEDLVFGFSLLAQDEKGEPFANTDWPIRISFPLFFRNLTEYFGGMDSNPHGLVRPGDIVSPRIPPRSDALVVQGPSESGAASPSRFTIAVVEGRAEFHDTERLGLYQVTAAAGGSTATPVDRFAVNLFSRLESDVAPKESIETSWTKVDASKGWETKRTDLWRWFVAAALVLLLVEGHIYGRRLGG